MQICRPMGCPLHGVMLGYARVRGKLLCWFQGVFHMIRKSKLLPVMMSQRTQSGLSITPQEALVDEPVRISVTGLSPNQLVTVHARLVENGLRMASCGHFVTTSEGHLDLTQHPSFSGTYTGVEPMGLFWSMRFEPGQRPGSRLIKKDVTKPYDVMVSVLGGHVPMETLCTWSGGYLCQEHVYRWYKGKDVRRKEVRAGNIRGAMFIPPGPGPHRGVIDIFGTIGGLLEYKASLLASHGFTTLALAYFDFEDLPKNFEDVDFNYFLEAVDWFKSQPEVSPSSIGIMGVSKGSDFALMLGMRRPEVKAVVSIGGTPFLMFCDLKFGDVYLPSGKLVMGDNVEETEEGVMARDAFQVSENILFDYTKMNARVLFLEGDDDGTLLPGVHDPALAKLTPEQRSKFTSVVYPRTGHLIEPPFAPVCTNTFHKALGLRIRWGGDIPYHAKSQEDAWKRILHFFRENIALRVPHVKTTSMRTSKL